MGRLTFRVLIALVALVSAASLVWAQGVPLSKGNEITMVGDRISIDVQAADIRSVLRSLADYGGRNIIAGPEVKGDVTVQLKDIVWDDALNIILAANGYGWEMSPTGGVIRVTTVKNLQTEALERESAARKKEDLLPLNTRIMRLNYAKADELAKALRSSLTNRGQIEVDVSSNSLVVKDIDSVLNGIEAMIGSLDLQTKQVEIVARLVDIDASVSRELGVQWMGTNLNRDGVDAIGDVTIDAPLAAPIGQFHVGTVGPGGNLDVTLQALASQNKANIISNPKITTLDNKEARILVGKKIPLIVSDAAGNPITQLTTIGIQMTVTPHINSNDMVTLDLAPEVSDLSSQATVQGGIIIVTSEASTRVMVNDGETAVIGGLIRTNESHREDGVPLLRDIPLVGNFFKSSNRVAENRELLIFVTPKIVEGGDLGMLDGSGDVGDAGMGETGQMDGDAAWGARP
jgi:type IV pilus assembly protein PilQ